MVYQNLDSAFVPSAPIPVMHPSADDICKEKKTLLAHYVEEACSRENKRHKLSRIPLWYFLHEVLVSDLSGSIISWIDEENLVFTIKKPLKIARLWGKIKNKDNMTYAKLARGLRYYYGKGVIEKHQGRRFTYRFVVSPKTKPVLRKHKRSVHPYNKICKEKSQNGPTSARTTSQQDDEIITEEDMGFLEILLADILPKGMNDDLMIDSPVNSEMSASPDVLSNVDMCSLNDYLSPDYLSADCMSPELFDSDNLTWLAATASEDSDFNSMDSQQYSNSNAIDTQQCSNFNAINTQQYNNYNDTSLMSTLQELTEILNLPNKHITTDSIEMKPVSFQQAPTEYNGLINGRLPSISVFQKPNMLFELKTESQYWTF